MDMVSKLKILDEIKAHSDIFIPVPPIRYRIRCPFCGDSQKDLKDAHCYIKCSNDPTEPLLYKCFLGNCGAQGKVDKNFLKLIGAKSSIIDVVDKQRYNRIGSIKKTNIDVITGEPIIPSKQTEYIEHRLGKGFTKDDYNRFKIVWDISNVYKFITSNRIRNTLPSNMDSITFLSDDKSMLLIRSFVDDGWRWNKVTLFESGNKAFYTIKTTLDLFTKDKIVINIAEGVFDILSAYKNFNEDNSVYIAVLGGDYIDGVEHAIAKGFMGDNISIRVYVDSDINITKLKQKLRRYKWLFMNITIYRNIMAKDIGVNIENIKLEETAV